MQRLITVSYNSPGHGPEGWAGFMSQRKVQLTPGRTWYWAARQRRQVWAAIFSARLDKVHSFPTHDPFSLMMWRVFQGNKTSKCSTAPTCPPSCPSPILCTTSSGLCLAPGLSMSTSMGVQSEANPLSILFCNYPDFLDLQHV